MSPVMRAHHWFAAIVLLGSISTSALAYGAGDDDDSANTENASAGDDDSAAAPAPAAQPPPAPAQESEICDDGRDNDGDGLVDCKDVIDCGKSPGCGQIRGGWGWVISVYGISFAALLAYALVVTLRLRALQRRGDR